MAVALLPAVSCPHAERCPGCPLIDQPPAAQLAAKAARVAGALARDPVLAGLAADAVRAAPELAGYRTRAKLVVAPGPRIGLYARGASHEALDLPECRVLSPAVAAAIAALRALVAAPPGAAGEALRAEAGGGRLRAVDVRETWDGEATGVLVTLVLRTPGAGVEAERGAAEALAAAVPWLRGVAVSLHDGRSPQLLGAPPQPVLGPVWHRDRVRADTPYALVSHGAFTQANRAQAAALHAEVEQALAPLAGRRVLDVYAGSGALGLALAAAGAHVAMVESFAPAAEAAARAAAEQALRARVETHPGPAEVVLPRLLASGADFDAAVVNPPRRGLAPAVREAIARLARLDVVYVSCEPETLARDLAHLAWLGWRAERVVPFDLLPLTDAVECVAALAPGPPPPLRVLHEEATLLAVAKPPFLPTVPHPEHAGSLLERVRALPGAGEAVPLHRLDAGTSGACLFARSPADAEPWQRALADARTGKRYLALVRGVGRAKGRVARPLRERGRTLPAATRYRRLSVYGGHALLEVALETGRTHQIRRHLAAIGQPVLGDERHGHAPSNRHAFERLGLDRPFLHCATLELPHPATGEPLRIEAPLAPDLEAVLARLAGGPVAGADRSRA